MHDTVKQVEKEEAQRRNAPAIARYRAAEARKDATQEATEHRRSGQANAKRVSEVAGKLSPSSPMKQPKSAPAPASSYFPEKPRQAEDNAPRANMTCCTYP
jgi:hypothetical protein